MNFISLTFVFLFPIVLILYWKLPWKYRELFLLAVSYFFYIKESSWAGGLLLLTTVTTYLAGLAIEKGRHKKGWLIFTVAVCIGLLIGLKYSVPPVGISFYTFQTMAYVIDVYRGEIAAEKNPRSYALFISFFPQLVAGPIERAGNLLGQLKEKHMKSRAALVNGAWLILRGFYKKVVVADYLAVYVDKVYSSPEKAGGIGAVLGTVFFAIQIYCDFSGYTDIARGAARMMGIRLMENFQHPYRAVSIQDFWRRWHISLTRWFTDYVYIPLGGNRVTVPRHLLNLLIVWFLTGLWHGASWNFVVWGLFYGVILITEKYFTGKILAKLPEAVQTLYTMILVMLGWVLFFSPTLGSALTWIGNMFGQGATGFMDSQALYLIMRNWLFWVAGIIGSTPFMHLLGKRLVFNEERPHTVLAGCLMTGLFVLCVAYLVTESYNPFLYFRF